MDKKQSQFTEIQSVDDLDFFPVFGNGTNQKISKENLFDQIKDETQIFIYPSTEMLQAADLVADPDLPVYVRNEETEYRLYKITSLAPGPSDIPLNNGNTATFQEEYSEIGFVLGPDPSINGALAVFSGTSGTQLQNGPVPTVPGVSFLGLATPVVQSFPRVNTDGSVILRSANGLKTDLSLDQVDNTSDLNKPVSNAVQAEIDAIYTEISFKAPLNSPVFTGNPQAPDPVTTDYDQSLSNTKFVKDVSVYRLPTMAALSALTPNFDGQRFSITDKSSVGDYGYAEYAFRQSYNYPVDGQFIVDALGAGQFERLPGHYDIDTTFNIGSGERFTTLTAALNFASGYKPIGGKVIELKLKSGFVLSEQVLFENLDFRHVIITSVDPVVTVARSAITATWRGIIPTFGFAKCFAPIFSVLFEMDTSGSDLDQYGIVCRTTQLRSEFSAGFRNAPNRNFEATWGSVVDIRYFDASGAGDIGIRISNGAYGYIRTCKANGCATGVSVSNAIADFTDGEATGCQFSGAATGGGLLLVSNATITGNVLSGSLDHANLIAEFGGKIIGTGTVVSGGSVDAVRADGGEVSIDFLVAATPGRYALHALNGGVINCPRSTISGGTISINCIDSEISLPGSTVTLPTTGQIIFCGGGKVSAQTSTFTSTAASANSIFAGSDGAEINLSKSNCNNGAIQLFRFFRGSKLIAPSFTGTGNTIAAGQLCRFDASEGQLSNSNLSGRAGGIGIQANLGSNVNITNTNCWNSGGVDTINDINIATGSIVHAHSASGGVNTAINTLTAAGIIFKA
jgi:hypothetical protein